MAPNRSSVRIVLAAAGSTKRRRIMARAIAFGTLTIGGWAASAQGQTCAWRYGIHQATPGLGGTVQDLVHFDPDGGGPLPMMLFACGGHSGRVSAYDGQQWTDVGAPIQFQGPNVMAVYAGELVAAGNFGELNGQPVGRIAKWNGTSWSPLGSGLNQEVHALAVYNGELYAAGDFNVAGGVFANRIARWNGSSWSAVGTGITGGVALVTSMAVVNGFLYVGGEFTAAGGVSAVNLARWNGSTWANTGNTNGRVNAMAAYVSPTTFGTLYISGAFTNVAGVAANRVARLPGGVSPVWSAMGAGLPGEGREAIMVRSTGASSHEVIAICHDGAGRIMRFTASGWVDIGPNFGGDTPRALSFYGGRYIASSATTVLFLDTPNNTWAPLGPGFNGAITAMEPMGGELVMAGHFSYVSDARHNRIVRWNGSSFLPMAGGIDGDVLVVQAFQNAIWAGGSFTSAGGVPTHLVARWNGAAWEPAGVPGGTAIQAMTVHNGELYAGGAGIGPLRWTGSGWSPVAGGLPGPVNALASHAGYLYAGGPQGLLPSRVIARLDPSLGQWVPVFASTTSTAKVLDMQSYGGSLYIAGDQLTSTHSVMRLISPTGGATVVGEIESIGGPTLAREMHVYGGALYVYGDFNRVAGLPAQGFARLDGSEWSPAGGGILSTASQFGAMAEFQNELIIGGPIFGVTYGTTPQPSRYWARWNCQGDCYANCDSSTTAPILNVADFSCFLTKFAAGDAYANCDNSTTQPILNVADFSCFLTKFAAGCP